VAGVTRPQVVSAALLGVETAAFAVILYFWIPLYRKLMSGPGGDRPGGDLIYVQLAAVVVMQACYWGRRRLVADGVMHSHGVILGHLLLFASRLAFVVVGSSFGLFIVRAQDTRPSPLGLAVSVWMLFAIFCFVLELEQMARARLDRARGR
jgi:hypothetical protein